jgi:hypothetical protein
VHDDPGPRARGREVELQRDEALARARLEVLEDVLVAGVVRDDELEARAASTSSPVFSTGRMRRSSVSGWITTTVSCRASTISSR